METPCSKIKHNGKQFDFIMKRCGCKYAECDKCNNDYLLCTLDYIGGCVVDVNSGDTLKNILFKYWIDTRQFPAVGDEVHMGQYYDEGFTEFEQYVIDNHKPTGRFTKPARH